MDSLTRATAPTAEWQDPEDNPPPRGKVLWVLTEWGRGIEAVWSDKYGFVAWTYFPKIPPKIKAKMNKKFDNQGEEG